MKKIIVFLIAGLLTFSACNNSKTESTVDPIQNEAEAFLNDYNAQYKKYLTASNEGQWKLNTHIVEGDTATSNSAARADEAFAKFTGSKEIIEIAKKFIEKESLLTELQIRQLKAILFAAGA